MKAIFETKSGSQYDDDIVTRYHFPRQYLRVAQQAVNDWIIYREPKSGGGTMAYIAVARLLAVDPDPQKLGFFYGRLTSYLQFDRPVPMRRSDAAFYEERLRNVGTNNIGHVLQGASIRSVSDPDFSGIVAAGLKDTLAPENQVRLELDPAHTDPVTAALVAASVEQQERHIVQLLTNRKVRDANYRRAVCDAYDNRCAVTGLRIINGGGKAEVQAAHIMPVADNGPDIVQNGLALSATVHWLFDRHLISLTDELGLLVSHNKVPSELRELFSKHLARIHLPADPRLHPHLLYVRRHRETYMG